MRPFEAFLNDYVSKEDVVATKVQCMCLMFDLSQHLTLEFDRNLVHVICDLVKDVEFVAADYAASEMDDDLDFALAAPFR